MPKVTKISLHCAEAEQVEGSNLRESLVRIPHGKSVREPDQGIPHLTLAQSHTNPPKLSLFSV